MTPTIAMVTIDCADPGKLAPFWTEALGAKVIHEIEGEFVILAAEAKPAVRLGLQRVPEPKSGKNRAHIDLYTENRAADVQRLVSLGATVLQEHEFPGFAWTVLADPDGNEFCIGADEQ